MEDFARKHKIVISIGFLLMALASPTAGVFAVESCVMMQRYQCAEWDDAGHKLGCEAMGGAHVLKPCSASLKESDIYGICMKPGIRDFRYMRPTDNARRNDSNECRDKGAPWVWTAKVACMLSYPSGKETCKPL